MRPHLVALSVAALTACGVPVAERVPAAAPRNPVTKVLLVSIDGLNPKSLTQLGAELTPNLHRLMAEGAGTPNARTLYERTETLPNHTGMLTGRRVALPRGMGVTFNVDNGSTLRKTAGHYVAGVFDVVHDRGGSTAMYVAKEKFKFLDRSWNAENGAVDHVGKNNGRDKVDRFVYAEAREDILVRKLRNELRKAPRTFTFLHLAAPDRAGHKDGGMSPSYLEAVRETDALLGKVLRTIDNNPALKEHLLVILTADHGTRAKSHAVATKLVNYRIPFYVWGPGVAVGRGLYPLNPSFKAPGRSRPSYGGPQPIRNGDAANLVTRQLGLARVPGSEFPAPVTH